ncbi:MAG: hypothetical protein C4567_06525 [Deltaproteobacteria bacterium]|nr:MAG: hypothetical protein C4567_06525 [Deltaproteobacteria bacterium]
MKEELINAVKAALLPELGEIKTALTLTNQRLDDTNRRLDDINSHLVDQSRRIDAVRAELGGRIDAVREELGNRIDAVREELGKRIDGIASRLDATNDRLNQLYEVVVRREEHEKLVTRIERIEREMEDLKKRVAA